MAACIILARLPTNPLEIGTIVETRPGNRIVTIIYPDRSDAEMYIKTVRARRNDIKFQIVELEI